jgi:hypothetical protein
MDARTWCRSASWCRATSATAPSITSPSAARGYAGSPTSKPTGHACLLVDRYSEDWSALWWVRLDGRARIVGDPDEKAHAIAALVDKYEQYADRAPTGPVLRG